VEIDLMADRASPRWCSGAALKLTADTEFLPESR
jgi:hypothetical protein